MKKLLLLILLVLPTGCTAQTTKAPLDTTTTQESETTPSSSIQDVFIEDESFIAQMDDIFIEIDEYVGKTIHFEGLVTSVIENTLDLEFAVTRYYDIPDDDHVHTISVGLNCSYEGTWPEEGTWVEVIGIIETQDINGEAYPIIRVTTLTPRTTKGQEKVTG